MWWSCGLVVVPSSRGHVQQVNDNRSRRSPFGCHVPDSSDLAPCACEGIERRGVVSTHLRRRRRTTTDVVVPRLPCRWQRRGSVVRSSARLRAEGGDMALLRRCWCVGACRTRCGRCLAALRRCWCWPLVAVMSEVGGRRGRWWWLRESGVVC